MKRFALLTVLLLVLATLGFADDVLKPGLVVAGGATLSWGINLDEMTTGFLNETDVDVDLTFITAFTHSKTGKGDVYGKIEVSDIAFSLQIAEDGVPDAGTALVWTAADDLAVSAAIVAGALEIGVYAAPDMVITQAVPVEDNDLVDGDDEIYIVDMEEALAANYTVGMYGTYIQYTAGPVVAKLVLKSAEDWDANTENDYAAGIETVLTFKPVTLGLGAYYGFYTGADIPLVYVTAGFAQGMFDVGAAFDLALEDTPVWDASAYATLTFKPETYFKVIAYLDSADNVDVKASFVEPAAEGFVSGFGFSLDAWVLDVMTDLEYLFTASASYAVGMFTPSVTVNVGNNEDEVVNPLAIDGDDTFTDAFFNVEVAVSTAMFDNVTLSATWTSGDFMDPDTAFYPGTIGSFVLAANISF